jgi:hypothetical protein
MDQQSALPHLPDAAVISILSHMPLKQRLQLALTCQSWAAAASLASTRTRVILSPVMEEGFGWWLQHRAGDIHHLTICAGPHSGAGGCITKPFLQLPCHKLTQLVSLSLQDVQLDLHLPSTRARNSNKHSKALSPVNSSSRGQHSVRTNKQPKAAGLLPFLQKLELINCDLFITQFEKLSCSLTSLTLQQLRLCPESRSGTSEEMKSKWQISDPTRLLNAFTSLMAATSTRLVNLSVDNAAYSAFWLSENPDMTATSYPLSTMQRLQRLSLCNVDMAAVFELMPPSLTALHLHNCNGMYAIPRQATVQLSNLVQLYLEELTLAPSLLLNFPQVHTCMLHL